MKSLFNANMTVSVPAATEDRALCLLTSRPAQVCHTRLHSRLHARMLNVYRVALWLFVGLVLQQARSLQSQLEGQCPEAADSPKKGREPHNDRPAGTHQGCMCFVWKDLQLCQRFSTVHNGEQHHLYLPVEARVPSSFSLTGFSIHSLLPL